MNTCKYALVSVFYWMGFAAIMAFTSTYLLEVGFSNTGIGLLIAAAGLISALLQPMVAGYADKENSLPLRRIIILLGSFHVLLGGAMAVNHGHSMLLAGLFYGSAIMLLQLLQPFINALGMESINYGKKLNFGVARASGSVGYAVTSYVLGAIVARYSVLFIPVAITITFLAFLVAVLFYPEEKQNWTTAKAAEKRIGNVTEHVTKQTGTSPFTFFKKYKRFALMLVGLLCIYISHVILNNFAIQIIESKGGGNGEMGITVAIAAMVEIPTLALFSQIVKKVRCDVLVKVSGIFFTLKSIGSLLAATVIAYYAVQVIQMLAWGLIVAALVYYVDGIMEKQDAVKGQAYATMIYTLGSVVGSLVGGRLLDYAGVEMLLLVGCVVAGVGAVIIFIAAEKVE